MSLQSVTTSLLSVGYEVSGPADGYPVVLVHGWPDDIRTWDGVLPGLHADGFRTYVPWVRGFGPTRFLSDDTMRSGQLVALGQDLVEFADALALSRYAVVGHDWGARAAYIASSLAAERVSACVALSVGYGTNSPHQTVTYAQAQARWYHWLMATPRGDKAVREDRRALTRYIWDQWFVAYRPDESEFARTAQSFESAAWADVTLHSYLVRWGYAPTDPQYAALESRFDPAPVQSVPTLMLHGGLDPVALPSSSEGKAGFFAGPYERRLIEGVGHFPQRENVSQTTVHILDWLRRYR